MNDRRVGGQIYEDWGDGTGKLYGTIGWWDPPAGYSQTSHMLGGGITLAHRYEFEEDGDGTVLRHEFSAFGPISDEMAEGINSHGSLESSRTSSTPGSSGRGDPATGALSATRDSSRPRRGCPATPALRHAMREIVTCL